MTPAEPAVPGYGDLTELSRGGFATIYRAWQPTFEREVAIKVLTGRADTGAADTFRRECAAIGALSGHPNIVTVYEAGATADGRLYIVMELLHGGSLADQLAARGTFEVSEVLDLGGRIAGAIESAHQAGILHRDLKPENILLSRLGEPKVADFGLAQLTSAAFPQSVGLTGTIVHAAPEVLAGERPTIASDLYSLASTLFCLLGGRPPFATTDDTSLVGLVGRITHDPPPDLRGSGVPDDLCRILEQGLAKVPTDRQHDVAQFARQLQAVQVALGQPVTRLPIESAGVRPPVGPAGPPERTPRVGRARLRRLRLAGALVLGVAAVLTVVLPRTANRASPLPALYQDNFDGGENWYEADDEVATLAYDDGGYRIVAKRTNDVILSDTSFRGGVYGEPLTMLTDVSVRVRARPNLDGSVFGLFCRYGPTADHYQAVVRSDGEVLLMKSQPPGRMTTLARGRVDGMSTGRQVALRLDCTGGRKAHIAVFADDRMVAEADDGEPIPVGSVGMLVSADGPRADVLFEDFALFGRRQAAG